MTFVVLQQKSIFEISTIIITITTSQNSSTPAQPPPSFEKIDRDRLTMAGFHTAVFVLLLAGILLPSSLLVDSFLIIVGSRNSFIKHEQFQLMQTTSNNISIEKYQHKTFNLTYLYKKASPGRENDRPLILIHPIGIGLSSWFWIKVLESYKGNPAIYAPDLIGCGINHGKIIQCIHAIFLQYKI